MWKINSSTIQYTYRFTDKFVRDLLKWACENKEIKSVAEITETNLTPRLRLLVEYGGFWKLREHMYKLATCKKIAAVRTTYLYFSKNYIKILKGRIKSYPHIDKDTTDYIKPVFKYFYDNLIDNEFFWNTYNPSGKYIKKSGIRDLDTSHKTCPYCDRNHIIPSSANNIDHLLPQSDFPFLSIFGRNLVIACTICNSKQVKGDDWALPILHPFYDNMEDILFFKFDNDKKEIRVCSKRKIQYERVTRQRGENFIRVLKLNKIYKKMWFMVENERRAIFESIADMDIFDAMENITNSSELVSLIKKGARKRAWMLNDFVQEETYTKLKSDYCSDFISQRNPILIEWLNDEYRKR
ncbi:HNH endonuclease [Neobacillus niacini]|uniref:HNH endonuclease n=1 Tax=Neobacillus niacini TaxID=86668 RepID=UPI002FFD760A